MQNETVIFMSGGGTDMNEEGGKPRQEEVQKGKEIGDKNPEDRGRRNPGRMDPPEKKKDEGNLLDKMITNLDLGTDEKKGVKEKLDGFIVTVRKGSKNPEEKDEDRERERITVPELVNRVREGLDEVKNTGQLSGKADDSIGVLADLLGKEFDTEAEKKEAAEKGEMTKTVELRSILIKDVLGSGDQKQGEALVAWLQEERKLKDEGKLEGFVGRLAKVAGLKPDDLGGLREIFETGQTDQGGEGLPAPLLSGDGGGTDAQGDRSGGDGGGEDGENGGNGADKPEKGGEKKDKSNSKLKALVDWLADPDNQRKLRKNFGIMVLILIALYVGVGMRAEAELIEKVFAGH